MASSRRRWRKLAAYEKQMLASPDQQISLTDPDSRSMATSGRGSGVVGYNVQVAVDTEHHLIVTHEVTNVGNDSSQLANMGKQAKAVLEADKLEAVADRGYFNGEEILACEEAGITVTLPKPMRSGAKSQGRFGKQDFVYLPEEDVYRCPAGEHLKYYFTATEHGQQLRRYWTNACRTCAIKDQCTTGNERRITRWEHEHVVEAVQERLDANPQAMRQRRETVEHPFGTMKARMGATHFLTKTLPKVATEMALSRARLQSDARHEHRRRQAADRGDGRLRHPSVGGCASSEPLRMRTERPRLPPERNRKNMLETAALRRDRPVKAARHPLRRVITRPRPISTVRRHCEA